MVNSLSYEQVKASTQDFYKIENETQELTLKCKELKSWISIGGGNFSEESVTEWMK
jgi:hypothetical protein